MGVLQCYIMCFVCTDLKFVSPDLSKTGQQEFYRKSAMPSRSTLTARIKIDLYDKESECITGSERNTLHFKPDGELSYFVMCSKTLLHFSAYTVVSTHREPTNCR